MTNHTKVNVRAALGFLSLPKEYADIDSFIGQSVRISTCGDCGSTVILTFPHPQFYSSLDLDCITPSSIIFDIYGKHQSLNDYYHCEPCHRTRSIRTFDGTVEAAYYSFNNDRGRSTIIRRDPQAASRHNLPYPKLEDLN